MKAAPFLLLAAALLFLSLPSAFAEKAEPQGYRSLRIQDIKLKSNYPLKRNIVTTVFWIGQGSSGYNSTTNYKSAWDTAWTRNFGGVDCPDRRGVAGLGTASLPKKFAPTLNPFYIALPYNDIKYPHISRRVIPWWNENLYRQTRRSQCKGKWVMIEHKGRVAFGQWEDVGPFRYDHYGYVFGNERPTIHSKAGLDVSPAIKDYLGLSGLDICNWRFVNDDEVPYGPWIEYAEQAILFTAIKSETPPARNKVR